ncbi:hypothetical protein Tco_0852556, partial [Tanacetum coccineum]
NTAKTRRPQPRSNIKNDRVPSESKSSCIKNKEVRVEEHHRNLLFSNNKKHMLSECNSIKLAIRNDKSKVVCAMLLMFQKLQLKGNISQWARNLKRYGLKKDLLHLSLGNLELALGGHRLEECLTLKEEIITSSKSECQSDISQGDNARTFNPKEPIRKRFPNSTFSLEGSSNLFMVRRLGMLKAYDRKSKASHKFHLEVSGNGLGYNLFSVGQFCDSDLEVAFRRKTCFVRNLEGVDLLKGNHTINLYTINLDEMASVSPICLMARATSTKS